MFEERKYPCRHHRPRSLNCANCPSWVTCRHFCDPRWHRGGCIEPLRTRIWIMVSLALGVRPEGLAQDAATPPDSKQLKMVKWTPDFQITNDDVTIVLDKIAEHSPIIS